MTKTTLTTKALNKWAYDKLGGWIPKKCKHNMVTIDSQFPPVFACKKCGIRDDQANWQPPDYCSDSSTRELVNSLEALIPEEDSWNYVNILLDNDPNASSERWQFKAITANAEQRVRACYEVLEGK